jgi:hypothetical protein
MNLSHGERHRIVVLFGFPRGLVLGLAGISVAGPLFGAVFGLLSGAALTISYLQDFTITVRLSLGFHSLLSRARAWSPPRDANAAPSKCLTFRANLRHKAYAAPILVSRPSQAATMLAVSRQFGSKRTL